MVHIHRATVAFEAVHISGVHSNHYARKIKLLEKVIVMLIIVIKGEVDLHLYISLMSLIIAILP